MSDNIKEVRTKLLIDIETEFENGSENDADTVRYCVDDDLKDLGWGVISCEILEDGINLNTLQEVIDRLTKEIDQYQDKLNKLIASEKIDCQEEDKQQTKINGIRIARELICKMYKEVEEKI